MRRGHKLSLRALTAWTVFTRWSVFTRWAFCTFPIVCSIAIWPVIPVATPTAKTPTSKIAREFHARIAAVLERREPRTPDLSYAIAQHYHQAGAAHAAQSAEYCLAAAQVARKQHALKEARRYLAMAEHSAHVAQKSFDFAQELMLIDAEQAKLMRQPA